MRIGRRTTLIVIGVALAGVGLLAWIASVTVARSDRLLAIAGRALGRELHADRIGFLWGGTVGVGLWGVQVADDPAFDAQEPFVAARKLEMRVRLLPVLRGRVIVDRVVIDGPVVRLVRAADGRLNLDSLRERAKAKKKEEREATPTPRLGPAFQLAQLTLRDGTLRFEDQVSQRALALEDVALDAEQPRMGAPMPITVHARVEGKDVRLAGLVSKGTVDLTSDAAWYQGTVRADSGALGPLVLGEGDAHVQLRPPAMMLEAGKVAFLGGAVTGWARLQSSGEGAGMRAEIDGRELDLEKLPIREGQPRPAGKMALHVSLTGPAPGGDDFLQALHGSGRFEVADGRIANLRVGSTLNEVLGPLLGADQTERLRTRYPDLFAGDDLPFTAFSGSARLGEGRIRSEDFVLAGASYQARGSGTLGLDGDLDAAVRLSASPALTEDIFGRSRARAALVDERGQLTVPLKVGGTLHHPHVTPDPAFAGQVAHALLGGTGIEDVAGSVLQRLLGGKRKRAR